MLFIELNESHQFVCYCENLEQVAPEHKDFVIEVTEELKELLGNKKPWFLETVEKKLYNIDDIDKFIEIEVPKSKEQLLYEKNEKLKQNILFLQQKQEEDKIQMQLAIAELIEMQGGGV